MGKNNLRVLTSFQEFLMQEETGQDKRHYGTPPLESKQKSNIIDYDKFCIILEQKAAILSQKFHDTCLDACLNKIEQEAGSLKYDDVLKMISRKTAIKDETSFVEAFIYSLAMDYLENQTFVDESKIRAKRANSDRAAKSIFCNKIAKEVMTRIVQETRKK
ncbi:MAG: hypothetical protein MJZ09_02690 [Bacteroidales bacterium]|nr:hypothetical protein [Bacteroidales bacterium]